MTSTGEAILFWVLAPVCVAGALGLIFARKAVHAALGIRGFDQPLGGLGLGELGDLDPDSPAERLGERGERIAPPAGEHHRGALCVQLAGDGGADAARGAGHQCGPPRQIEHAHASAGHN